MSRVFLLAFVTALSPVRVVVVWWRLPEENSDYQQDEKKYHVFDVHFKIILRSVEKVSNWFRTNTPTFRARGNELSPSTQGLYFRAWPELWKHIQKTRFR
jgi:hypothetical protein